MVLVDTTIWIDLLRGRRTSAVALLRELLELGEAAAAPVIIQEILQGASSAESFEQLRTHFQAIPMLQPQPGLVTHIEAAALYARARWRGITPRSPHDCLIARLAVEHGVPLLHGDRDFELLAKVEPALVLV